MIALLVAVLLALPPTPAAWTAALMLGRPDVAPALVRVCRRESRCQPGPGGWATRGARGLSAAAHAHRLPPCAPAWVHDVPIVQAIVAERKFERECEPARSRWCPRSGS